MSSITVCSRCMRALRTAARAEQLQNHRASRAATALQRKHSYLSAQQPSSRTYSTQSSKWQQAAQKQRKPSHSPITSEPTASRTSNTPQPTQSTKPSPFSSDTPAPDGPSTAQMQKHIATTLTSTRASLPSSLARTLRTTLPNTATTYITYGLTEALFKSCSSHTAYTIPQKQRTAILSGTGPPKTASGEDIGIPDPSVTSSTRQFFFSDTGLALLPTFSTWSQTTFLHMYLLTVRLRSLPQGKSGALTTTSSTPGSFQNFQQYLLEHFSQEAENHMLLLHTITARGIRNRYLKDLFLQWRGILAAYDEGLVKSDAVLGSAVWRNLFKGDEDVDWRNVAMVVGHMRKAIVELDKVKEVNELPKRLDGPEGVWARSLVGVREMVDKQSSGMREGFERP